MKHMRIRFSIWVVWRLMSLVYAIGRVGLAVKGVCRSLYAFLYTILLRLEMTRLRCTRNKYLQRRDE